MRSWPRLTALVRELLASRARSSGTEIREHRRLELLQAMTSSLSRALTVEDVARVVVEEGTAKLLAPRGGLWKISPDGSVLELVYDKGYSPPLREAVRKVPVDSRLPLARVLTTEKPCWVESREAYIRDFGDGNEQTYAVRTSDETSFFCAPLLVEGKAVGCMAFNYEERHVYSESEKRFVEALADQCALALHRAELLTSERKARQAAELEQHRFRAVFEQSTDGILLLDDAARIVDMNAAGCALFRRHRADIVGHFTHEFVSAEDRPFEKRLATFLEVGRVEQSERLMFLPDGSVRHIELSATAHVMPGLHVTTFRDIEDRKRSEESLRFLEEATRLFASSLDPEHTLTAMARLAVPRLSDWMAIDLLQPDGSLRRVTVQHVDPKKLDLARALEERRPRSMQDPGGVAPVIRTGEPNLTERITDEMLVAALSSDPEYLAILREIGLVSLMIIPLPVKGATRGAITFAFAESRRQFGSADVAFAQELARRAGASLENATSYRELEEANRAKDLFLRRADNLQMIASELVTVATVEDIARVFARTQRAALGALTCALYVLRDGSLHAMALEGLPESVVQTFRVVPLGQSIPTCQACREGRPVWITDHARIVEMLGSVGSGDFGIRSVVALPLSFGARPIGAVSFGFETRHEFAADERTYLLAIGALWSQAVHRVQLVEEERESLRTSANRANRLYQLTTALAGTLTTASVAVQFCEHAPHAVSSDSASVWLVDGAEPEPSIADLRGERAHTHARLPLTSATGSPLGVVTYAWAHPRTISDEDRQLLAAVADQCAVALDRARAYEAEARALRNKDEFLAMLGHELRNPLAPILTATSLIRLRGAASERELGILERQGRHLVRLVDDLLDVSRIASGKLVLRLEPVEIGDVIAHALESVSKPFEDKLLRLEVQAPPTGLAVNGDRDRLSQVMTNLLVNAAKFTQPEGAVRITAERQGGAVVIEVRDEGEGITQELLPYVFDLFAQGRQSSDRQGGGLGLGLAIARSIILAHGGVIDAASPGQDQGTTVRISLPFLERDPSVPIESEISRPTPIAAIDARRILVVDDNADGAEMLADLLGMLGYQTFVASDGPEALSLVERVRPDAAILDIGLPGMDGNDLAAALIGRFGDQAPVLIALTGYAQESDRDRSVKAGFSAHFAKPVDIDKLAETLERAFATE